LAGGGFGASQTWIEKMKIRKLYTFVEDTLNEAGKSGGPLLRKVAAVAIVENPHAGRFVEDLKPMIDASERLGHELSKMAVQALGPYRAQSYGKGGIVGLAGEQEHINALLTTTFANPLREAVGGGAAWISSMTKRGGPGTSIDIPLASKDALYVRSHYDGMTITFHDAPLPDEIAVIICVANRGRLNARVGGLKFEEIKGEDGLR
jgi:Amino acid synthesis